MTYKELLSAAAIALTFIAFFPYIRSIRSGATKPHAFSWVIWGLTTFTVALAQLADNAGAGAWPIAVSGVITLYVAALAYARRADTTITAVDWLFFVSALSAFPLWWLTADPLWAVVILTIVDLLGFGPTFRKAYLHPFDEQLLFFVLMIARNLISIGALEHYSTTTALWPAAIAVVAIVFVIMALHRRKVVIQP